MLMKKNNMGFILFLKNFSLLFLLVSAAISSTSFAGRVPVLSADASKTYDQELKSWAPSRSRHDEEVSDQIHERLLKVVKTNDYGRYDPAPALAKPPFKLIPN